MKIFGVFMKIEKIEDIYQIEGSKFHWTRYYHLESILKHGILSFDGMKKKGIEYQYAPRDAQIKYGKCKVSIVDFDGEKTEYEKWREKKFDTLITRPPEDRPYYINIWAFNNDVTCVLSPNIETIPEGIFNYEHLVKDHIPSEKILAVCYNLEIIEQEYEDKSKEVINEIERICKKYDIVLIPHDTRKFREQYYAEK